VKYDFYFQITMSQIFKNGNEVSVFKENG
jgi:hypothetical protein